MGCLRPLNYPIEPPPRRRTNLEYRLRRLLEIPNANVAIADNARVELEWSLLGLWGMALYAQAEIHKHGGDPARISIACVLRSYRRMMRDYRHPAQRGSSLRSLLRSALRDQYQRKNKASRNYPCKKRHDPPPRPPVILEASNEEVFHARIWRYVLSKGVTA